ncbi:hypothetical protein Gotur_012083 [Gossypium turneri]
MSRSQKSLWGQDRSTDKRQSDIGTWQEF